MQLDIARQRQFAEDGFVIIPNARTTAQIAELRARADAIVDAFTDEEPRSIFRSAGERSKDDAGFMSSGSSVRCFFEEEALAADGRLVAPKDRAINKIGHAMHDLDPVFSRFSHGDDLQTIARGVGLAAPRIYQSMYIFKQPQIGGEIRWHQDATYFVTEPVSVTTFWFALEDAAVDNGCLWVQPGGHRTPLRERFVVDAGAARLETLDAMPWPDRRASLPLEVPAGTLVVFHGLLPHYSAPNRSPRSRRAYTLHAVDAAATYARTNWLQRDAAFPVRDFCNAAQ